MWAAHSTVLPDMSIWYASWRNAATCPFVQKRDRYCGEIYRQQNKHQDPHPAWEPTSVPHRLDSERPDRRAGRELVTAIRSHNEIRWASAAFELRMIDPLKRLVLRTCERANLPL